MEAAMKYPEIVRFHGHDCPSLAIGYRMALAGLEALKSIRSEDEDLVAIVENDACGVDALQCLTGCTFGKGNLIFRDYGKQVYTIYSRSRRKGVRVRFNGQSVPVEIRNDRKAFAEWILASRAEGILEVKTVDIQEPEFAKTRNSLPCDICGESVMETRIHDLGGKYACIPCFEKVCLEK